MKGTHWYDAEEEIRGNLDVYLELYDRRRPHRGRVRTVFRAKLKEAEKAARPQPRKEEKEAT